MKKNRSFYLPQWAIDRLVGTGSGSNYIVRILKEREMDFHAALAALKKSGLEVNEIKSICDGLADAELPLLCHPELIIDLLAVKDGMFPLCQKLSANPELAISVLILAREMWAKNQYCRNMLNSLEK